jgi:pyruvate ferredoxin oxidoreductase alpha subunit
MDLTIAAFKIAEDPRVILPVSVNLDGFILSHVIEPIEMPEPGGSGRLAAPL